MDEKDRERDEARLDEALDESFPASDSPANTVEVGVRVAPPVPSVASVRDDPAKHRLELELDGEVAFLLYQRTAESLTIVHTEVPPALRGRHLGNLLVQAAVGAARTQGLRLIAVCPFARAYLKKHPIGG